MISNHVEDEFGSLQNEENTNMLSYESYEIWGSLESSVTG